MGQDDYDSPWKEGLVKYLPRFFEFFFAEIFEDVDWSRKARFLDKELQAVAPTKVENKRAGTRVVDALVELHRKTGEKALVLVHIEIQAQRVRDFEKRMLLYHTRILERYKKPVCSLVILADKNQRWRPERYREELVRGLHKAGLSKQDVRSFFRLVDWILRLTPEREAQFMVRLQEMEKEKGMPYITSIERIGREAGRTEGRRAALIDVLQARFGEPPLALISKLNGISDLEQLRRLNQLAATVESLQDFDRELLSS